MDIFKGALSAVREQVDAFILQWFERYNQPEGTLLKEALLYATVGGGKRLRAFLVFSAAGAGGRVFCGETALRAAAAVECFHAYSLVHDDLPAMDDDEYRRGQLTVHKKYGEAMGILVGDALQTTAFEMLSDVSTQEEKGILLVRCLARAGGASGMVMGQHLDLIAEQRGTHTVSQILDVQRLKTGALIEASCLMGGIIGGLSAGELVSLKEYAQLIGLAFQVKDDLLDFTSSFEQTGKAVGKDAARGKATFVTLEGADVAQQRLEMLMERAIKIAHTLPCGGILEDIVRYIGQRDG